MDNHNLFPAIEYPLVHYNGKAVYNELFQFFSSDGETDYGFSDYQEAFMDVYDKRGGRLLKSFDSIYLVKSDNDLIFNASAADMEFSDLGKYYYEMYYLQAGGYEVTLLYGQFTVI